MDIGEAAGKVDKKLEWFVRRGNAPFLCYWKGSLPFIAFEAVAKT